MAYLGVAFVFLLSVGFVQCAGERTHCEPDSVAPDIQVNTTERLASLRALFASVMVAGADTSIHAYIVPSEDAHKSEYPSAYAKRRGFISGFSGSAGVAVVTTTKAALWTDGRYFLEAEDALDCNWLFMKDGLAETPSITDWLIQELQSITNATVGASPRLLDSSTWIDYTAKFDPTGITLVPVYPELVSEVWNDPKWNRPAQANSDIFVLGMNFAGRTWQNKIADVRAKMVEAKTQALIVTGLDETAWLFNLRASDIDYVPVFNSFAIVEMTKIRLYIISISTKIAPLEDHLNVNTDGTCKPGGNLCAEVVDYFEFYIDVTALAADSGVEKVWISYVANYAIFSSIPEDKIYQKNTPIALLKAMKNSVEQAGMASSHIRDSSALVAFVQKLEKQVKAGEAWTEISAADDLEAHRRAEIHNMGLSFETISASGPNGAVIHYSPTPATDRAITTDDMYLLDSGGQYMDGTTDVTRTFHFGTPTDYEKECYTRVLMGTIDLAMLKWPEDSMYGRDIDVMARAPIWDAGLRYRHGTGHGIGSFLSVHEGPARISYGYRAQEEKIYHGMFFSDEPGYYEDGKFGIRLETIVMVDIVETKYKYQNTTFLGFTPITMVPFEPNLIMYDMLNKRQVAWLNKYNVDCMKTVGKMLKDSSKTEAYDWMVARTQPIEDEPCKPETSAAAKSALALSLIALSSLHWIFSQ